MVDNLQSHIAHATLRVRVFVVRIIVVNGFHPHQIFRSVVGVGIGVIFVTIIVKTSVTTITTIKTDANITITSIHPTTDFRRP